MTKTEALDLGDLFTATPALDGILKCCVEPSKGEAVKLNLIYLRFHEDKPKEHELAEALFHELINYCIPKKKLMEERARAKANGIPPETLSVKLFAEARRAFIKYKPKNKSTKMRFSEVGELLSYCVAIHFLGAAQIAAKMALKTNSEMPVFGVDGIHASLEDDGTLAVFTGRCAGTIPCV